MGKPRLSPKGPRGSKVQLRRCPEVQGAQLLKRSVGEGCRGVGFVTDKRFYRAWWMGLEGGRPGQSGGVEGYQDVEADVPRDQQGSGLSSPWSSRPVRPSSLYSPNSGLRC